jgi:glycosyltransferase involved in cell wall biosynthesis
MARILFVAPQPSSFIELDRELLAERHEVVPVYGRRPPRNLRALARAVRQADVVFGWWAHLHTLAPFALARRAATPTVLIVGGFDTASLPDIGYGNQRGGWRRRVSRFVMARADVLATNSHYSVGELERNAGVPPERVTVVHHGVPDPFRAEPADPEPIAITIGNVDAVNLERKGLRPFVLAAAELPDVRFEVVGRDVDGAAATLRALAPANVELVGFASQAELERRLRRAAAYVQASQHEGFGVSVAEAMLAGAIPVITGVGALPEVVGDVGIVVDDAAPATLAAAVRRALDAGPERRRAARERVLREFSVKQRREGLEALIGRALSRTRP